MGMPSNHPYTPGPNSIRHDELNAYSSILSNWNIENKTVDLPNYKVTSSGTLVINWPPVRSELKINGTVLVRSHKRVPSRWHQFWYWALLGWSWTKVSD